MGRHDIHNSETPALCGSCEVRHRGLCGALSGDQLMMLSKHSRIVRHPAGTELIADDSDITSYANVMRGVVKLSKMLDDGRQQVVGLQFAPDFLGRLFGRQNTLSAQAASDVELCKVPKAALEAMVGDNPALEHRLLEQTLRELDDARDWMVTLGRKTASEKVASFLYLVATHIDPVAEAERQQGENADARFDLPLSRADIADFLGLTIETVSRQLTRLRKEEIISVVNNRTFVIPDLKCLANRCG
ncbi:Crp/Fnr family transcriptional regulator [Pelagibacterium luteolum]|uniref:CRP/FNR family transcriptional regulator, anaerobic regulatory protein n=1 Tax=Pelagibacterium luteolum TaxID=440168 RepID=A0A1G7UZU5_9HYPH|nr:Crp/Fnr family transcriptional regulator [Pelagibacterium luteolum]SDG52808.1 CRP/FNR family transcriptional regulator, anaerobic regulatory protein [Pelagibacterium luteolum]